MTGAHILVSSGACRPAGAAKMLHSNGVRKLDLILDALCRGIHSIDFHQGSSNVLTHGPERPPARVPAPPNCRSSLRLCFRPRPDCRTE